MGLFDSIRDAKNRQKAATLQKCDRGGGGGSASSQRSGVAYGDANSYKEAVVLANKLWNTTNCATVNVIYPGGQFVITTNKYGVVQGYKCAG